MNEGKLSKKNKLNKSLMKQINRREKYEKDNTKI